MSIRSRTLAIIGMTLLVLTGVLYAFSQLILLEGYLTIEQDAVSVNIQRAQNAVNQKIDFYRNIGIDYAHWDDTYDYMVGQNDGYIADTIMPSLYSNYELEFILMVNPGGEIVFSEGYALDDQEITPVADDLTEYAKAHGDVLMPRDEQGRLIGDGIAGIVNLPSRTVILSSTPILPSDNSGEPAGVLIWGRTFDDSLVGEISEQTALNLSVVSADPALVDAASSDGSDGDLPIVVNRVSNSQTITSALLTDIEGVAGLMIRLETQRRVFQQGQQSITYFIVATLVIGLMAAAAIALMLERTVLSRIAYLNAHVSRIRQSSDVRSRVTVSGNDEVATLSTNINAMLDALQAQEKIKLARDNALEAARLKAEILANVSHDARTPLSVIMLRSELLLKGMYGALTERQKEVFQQILFNTDQLMSFIENLLEASHLDAGQLQLNVAPFQPAKLLDHVQHSLEPLAQEKQIRLEVELSGDVPPVLCGDEKRIDRILTNLVSNAIKFTSGGNVSARIWRPDADHWGIEVRDTGIGISTEDQQRIFDAFWQVDGSTTRAASSGVGLGLSIVRQLTELMDGKISVASEIGSGSVFTVILPLRQSANGAVHEQPALCVDR